MSLEKLEKAFRFLQKYPWFCVEKVSLFDDLEFLKAETFTKMTLKSAKNAKVNARESFCLKIESLFVKT